VLLGAQAIKCAVGTWPAMSDPMTTVSPSSALLLVHLRSVALATQAAAVLLAAFVLHMPLPLAADALILPPPGGMPGAAWSRRPGN
jgi:hypothetical protein